jgi:hypothetical protein
MAYCREKLCVLGRHELIVFAMEDEDGPQS